VYEYRFGGTGDNFNLPNMAACFPVGVDSTQTRFDTPGKTGGTYAVTIATHTHPINHDHAVATTSQDPAHAHSVPAHLHPMSHDHAAASGTTSAAGAHSHQTSYDQTNAVDGSGYNLGRPYGASGTALQTGTDTEAAHTHTVSINLPTYTGNTGNSGVFNTGTANAHTHTLDLPNYTGTSGVPNGTLGTEQIPPFVVVHYICRLD
jgi:hypothetical protein